MSIVNLSCGSVAKMTKSRLKMRGGHDSFLRKESAYYLIKMKGYNQKEAAQEVNVSEKTVAKWAKEGQWNDKKFNKKNASLEPTMKQFLLYIFINAPKLHNRINNLWESFSDTYKIDFK